MNSGNGYGIIKKIKFELNTNIKMVCIEWNIYIIEKCKGNYSKKSDALKRFDWLKI